ncbi:MAG: S1 RNA-binding domain-containing protein [Sedimentisphaerales bacterium]|nr:S1 RNA-binding domain-containing protein [Sedimentisphaerales bacterium]
MSENFDNETKNENQEMPDLNSIPHDNNSPVSPSEQKIPVSGDDNELDKEIQEALGDMSILDVYGMAEENSSDSEAHAGMVINVDKTQDHSSVPGINRGKVISVSNDGVFVDLGGKSQGYLPKEEFEEDEKIDVGTEVDVVIVRYDARDGLLILSRKTAEQRLLRSHLKEGALVEARVVGSNKGGLELDIKGLKAFMPISQIDIHRIDELDGLINQRWVCEVMQVERGDKNIVLSRRKVLEREELEKRDKLWEELQEGQLRNGKVRSIADYGAFVDLGGIDGLLHVSELSWARVKHPREILEVGQSIDVLVIEIDKEKHRISLSLRKAGGDPWSTIEQKYKVGEHYKAQITSLMNFGAFAQLEPGLEGLIPIGEMTWAGRIKHPSDIVQPGMMVEVQILKIDAKKRKVSLSMKSLQENPWSNIDQKYVRNNVYIGTISRLTDFGAFVTLEAGVDGLIHVSEISEKRVNKPSDVLTEGQEVQVRVLHVEKDNQRISLSLKGISSDEHEEKTNQPDREEYEKKRKDRPLRGGLSW